MPFLIDWAVLPFLQGVLIPAQKRCPPVSNAGTQSVEYCNNRQTGCKGRHRVSIPRPWILMFGERFIGVFGRTSLRKHSLQYLRQTPFLFAFTQAAFLCQQVYSYNPAILVFLYYHSKAISQLFHVVLVG